MRTLAGNIISGVVVSTIRSINLYALPRAEDQDDLNIIHARVISGRVEVRTSVDTCISWDCFSYQVSLRRSEDDVVTLNCQINFQVSLSRVK